LKINLLTLRTQQHLQFNYIVHFEFDV
jgi:hypothetical protein